MRNLSDAQPSVFSTSVLIEHTVQCINDKQTVHNILELKRSLTC